MKYFILFTLAVLCIVNTHAQRRKDFTDPIYGDSKPRADTGTTSLTPTSGELLAKGGRNLIAGTVFQLIGAGGMAILYSDNPEPATILGGASMLVGLCFQIQGYSLMVKAGKKLYNQSLGAMYIEPSASGLGVKLRF